MAILTKKFISSLLKVILGQKLRIKLTGLHRDKPPTKQYLTPPAWELWYESQFIPNKIFKILSWISGALITLTVTLPSWAFRAFEARKVTTWGPTSFMVQITNPLKNGKKSVSLKIFYLSDLFFLIFTISWVAGQSPVGAFGLDSKHPRDLAPARHLRAQRYLTVWSDSSSRGRNSYVTNSFLDLFEVKKINKKIIKFEFLRN